MKVVCVSTTLSDDVLEAVGGSARWEMDQKGSLTVGKEYLVYGLVFIVDRNGYDSGAHVLIVPDVGYLVQFRLAYFRVSDPRASRFWQVRQKDPTYVTLLPPSFYAEGYIEKYNRQDEFKPDEIGEVLDDFDEVTQKLKAESEEG